MGAGKRQLPTVQLQADKRAGLLAQILTQRLLFRRIQTARAIAIKEAVEQPGLFGARDQVLDLEGDALW